MFRFKRAILLSAIMVLAALLWGCRVVEPIKVPLVTAAISDVCYISPAYVLDYTNLGWFQLDETNPAKTFTLGGIECVVTAEPLTEVPGDDQFALRKLFIKTPMQELTIGHDNDLVFKPVELMLDNGRKYLLAGCGFSDFVTDHETQKKSIVTRCAICSAGVQVGKIPSPFQSTITLYDSNLDGFYTSGDDGIVVGSPTAVAYYGSKGYLAQPISKYISTPPPSGGIFEIQKLAKDGSELTLLPYRGPTASLEVVLPPNYSGQIIMTSADTGLNVTLNGKAGEVVTVIPGDYTILAAMLSSDTPLPDSSHNLGVRVSGAGMPALKVKAGAKQVLVMSGPKVLEFQAALVDGKLKITPEMYFNVEIKGQAGETYSCVTDTKNPAEIYLNVDGQSTFLGKAEYG